MSKITNKNLHYDNTLPPFLARLQANNNNSDGRHEFSIARPKKARNAEEDAEDEPVYFNEESGETLTKGEWEAREAEEEKEAQGKDTENAGSGDGALKDATKGDGAKEKVATIGGIKKRKMGKVVGAEDDEAIDSGSGEKKQKTEGKKVEKGKGKPAAKKGKKIKLSFGDDE